MGVPRSRSHFSGGGAPGAEPGPTRCTAQRRVFPEGEYHTCRALLSAALCSVNTAPAGKGPWVRQCS